MARPNFDKLTVGRQLTDIMLRVLRVEPKDKKGGGEGYARLTVTDGRKEITAMLWNVSATRAEDLMADVEKCPFIRCDAKVTEYNGEVNLHISNVETTDEAPGDATDYFKKSPRPLEEMLEELDARIARIKNAQLRELVEILIGKGGLYRHEFIHAPAAKGRHHAYVHGLLEHTLDVAHNVEQDIFRHESQGLPIFADLLRAGALLHDIGKVRELLFQHGAYSYSSEGNDLGHSAIGMLMVQEIALNPEGEYFGGRAFHPELLQKVLHLIASHHGKLEHGAVVEPNMLEAFLLHHADNKSATVFYYHEAIADAKEGAEYIHKTKLDGRSIFLGMPRLMAELGVN